MRVDPNGNAWWNWLISGLQIVAGIVLVATGVGAGFSGVMDAIDVNYWLAKQFQ